MKKLLSVLVAVVFPLMLFAQLKAPTETAIDTLMIIQCSYQDMDISSPADWPCRFFTESVTKIYIAGSTYKKGAPSFKRTNSYEDSWKGHINYFSYGDATVSGHTATVYKVLSSSDCKDYPMRKYGIDDYAFYVVALKDAIDNDDDSSKILRVIASWELSSKDEKLRMIDRIKPLVPDVANMSNDEIIAGVDSVILNIYKGL